MNSALKLFLLCLLFQFSLFAQDKTKLGESEIRDSERIKFTNRSNQRAAESVKKQNDSIGKKTF